MNIVFHKLTFKNFMSYGNTNTSINFINGIDIILGTNGKGKSAILDALFYGLYGKPHRKIKTSTLINDINKKELLVQIEFSANDVSYKIIRGLKPNILEIYRNNILLPQESSVKKYQEIFEENILKINETSFRQLVMLGANISSTKPFLELSQSEKEEVFSSIISTSIFNNIQEIIKLRLNKAKTIEADNEYKLSILQSSIELEENNLLKMKASNEINQDNTKRRKNELQQEIDNINNEILKIESIIQKTKVLRGKYQEAESKLNNTINNINLNQEKVHTLKLSIAQINDFMKSHSICIGCDKLNDLSTIDINSIDSLKDELLKTETELEALYKNKDEYDNIVHDLKEKLLKVKVIIKNKTNLEQRLSSVVQEKEHLDNFKFINIDESNLIKLNESINEVQDILSKTKDEIYNLVTLKKLIVNKDLKGFIINKRLPILNKLINEYLEKFNFSDFSMVIGPNFKEQIKTSRGIEKEFNQLSNGQKFRLTQSLVFAFLKYAEIKNAVKTNILIADEVLDTSLDSNGRDDLLRILSEDFGAHKNIIIITHNEEIKSKEELFNRTINITKKDAFSKINIKGEG